MIYFQNLFPDFSADFIMGLIQRDLGYKLYIFQMTCILDFLPDIFLYYNKVKRLMCLEYKYILQSHAFVDIFLIYLIII